jgi:hypothetical protein
VRKHSGLEAFKTSFFLCFKNPATEKLYQHHLVVSTQHSVRFVCILQALFSSLLLDQVGGSKQIYVLELFLMSLLATFALKGRYLLLQIVLVSIF